MQQSADVDEKTFWQFCASPPLGKQRGANAKGCPAWIDVPAPTPEEARLSAEAKKRRLMDEVTRAMAPLEDAVDLDMATDAEKATLMVWKKYRVLLNRVDISTAPDIDWPEAPA
ncbi:tail fiber assembly protein [Candidatus Sodalis pierantonius]|uniref:tail fiber assembly protein n=1 Tax=Candidatus Sodalis pierantonii TaxID=1486991 RepID=UPI0009DCB68C|nr:tail fiber assembly protein [Candidatus Sodalis pierantonius]